MFTLPGLKLYNSESSNCMKNILQISAKTITFELIYIDHHCSGFHFKEIVGVHPILKINYISVF